MKSAFETRSGKLLLGDMIERIAEIDDESVDQIVLDSPFGVLDPKEHPWDAIGDLGDFTRSWLPKLLLKLKPDGGMVVFWPEKHLDLGFSIFRPQRLLIWDHGCNSFGDWGYGYTPILVVRRNKRRRGICRSNVLSFPSPSKGREADRRYHPTQKPIWLLEELIAAETLPGDLVLDPFAGSCTTAVACERLGRRWLCIEKDEGFFEAAVERLQSVVRPSDTVEVSVSEHELYSEWALLQTSTHAWELKIVPIADIIVVSGRLRQDLGDIEMLAHDIARTMLLTPLLVDDGLRLIDGQRRLLACQHLGWTHIIVHVIHFESYGRADHE